jgi:hypothetical protein
MAGAKKKAAKAATGPKALKGSAQARRCLAVMLEALSGLRSTTEAAEAMGVSLSRYYYLETRALNGMLAALEPRPRGPKKTPEKAIAALQREKKVLVREVARHQALLRAAQRTVGLASPKKAAKGGAKRRRRGSRGATVLQTLRDVDPGQEGGAHGTTHEGLAADGIDRGQPASA